NIAMAASMTSLFTGDSDIERFSAGDIWKHSLSMGVGSKMLYAARKRPGGDEAFLAGLIADVGLLIERQALLYKMRVVIERFFENCGDFCALEREILGVDHQLVGMALGRQWRFPNAICQTIGHHHEPPATDAAESELTATVYLADRLACRMEAGFCSYGPDAPIDPAVLSRLKLTPADAQHVHDEMPAQIESAAKIFAPEDR
ncbi:MAG TPA: HDOD domain-containing protein, partial [Phycisphaerae bacterium]|nr:HDOD domain-containing protein [Phycisphaerae bacterium]